MKSLIENRIVEMHNLIKFLELPDYESVYANDNSIYKEKDGSITINDCYSIDLTNKTLTEYNFDWQDNLIDSKIHSIYKKEQKINHAYNILIIAVKEKIQNKLVNDALHSVLKTGKPNLMQPCDFFGTSGEL